MKAYDTAVKKPTVDEHPRINRINNRTDNRNGCYRVLPGGKDKENQALFAADPWFTVVVHKTFALCIKLFSR